MISLVPETGFMDKEYFPWKKTQELIWPSQFSFPKISVIVPSYNQGEYLEETLLSIINQQYPNIELIIIDGGSTDKSVEIIKKFESKITYWVSEKDQGQSHAINKGLTIATGEWVAWMNSDDCYLEGALHYIFCNTPYKCYDLIHGSCSSGVDLVNRKVRIQQHNFKKSVFHLLLFFHSTQYIIPSQSVFLRRAILKKSGLINERLNYVMDMEWYVRIFKHTKRIYFYKNAICFFRHNPLAKSGMSSLKMNIEAKEVATKNIGQLSIFRQFILTRILKDDTDFKSKFYAEKRPNMFEWFSILIHYPFCALYSVHFWSYFKKLFTRGY